MQRSVLRVALMRPHRVRQSSSHFLGKHPDRPKFTGKPEVTELLPVSRRYTRNVTGATGHLLVDFT
jgi:hypothetical protein